MTAGQAALGVGASLRRKEDARFLHGLGRFVGDITRPGMLEVAFLRSPVAHARLHGVTKPAGAEKRVFTLADLGDVRTIRANSALLGFRVSEQPALAIGKLRHVGEAIAACVAGTRAEAEDLVAACGLDYETLPAVHDMLAAPLPAQPLIHDGWSMNAFLETRRDDDVGNLDAIAAAKVTRTLRTSRQCMAPIEGRGVLAEWDPRLEQMIVTTSTQMPHVTKSGLADCLAIDEGQVRIASPDVGGGFGYQGILLAEAVVCASIARLLGRPVRWLEDRYEQLGRRQLPRASLCHHRVGRPRRQAFGHGMRGHGRCRRLLVLSLRRLPEAAQVGSILPGPYICRFSAATPSRPAPTSRRSCPIAAWRGPACATPWRHADAWRAARPHARRSGSPISCRRARCLTATWWARCSTAAITRRRCAARWRPSISSHPRAPGQGRDGGLRPRHLLRAGRARHVGLSRLGIPFVPGFEQAHVRLSPDGVLEVRVACTATARAWRRPWRRSRTRSWASIPTRCAWSMATPRSRPIRPAPGAAAPW
jgi:carbon-monoxide dehydrogenase large subunit